MPRGPGFPRAIRDTAVDEYLSGRATMPEIAKALGVTTPTISRWVEKARREGRTPAPAPTATPDIASRVAALAPPPAAPEEPPPGLGDGSTTELLAALRRQYTAQLSTAAHADRQGDVKAATAARSAATKLITEIRQLQAAARDEGGDALAITRDDVDAAHLEVRRRMDEIAHARGETLMWSLDGTPVVRVAPTSETVTAERNSVTRDGGNRGGPGA